MSGEDTREALVLKPCPFCGGKASKVAVEEPSNVGGYVIQCESCECCTRVWFPVKDSVDRILADAWNRREAADHLAAPGEKSLIVELRQIVSDRRTDLRTTQILEELFRVWEDAMADAQICSLSETAEEAFYSLTQHKCPACGAFARVFTVPPRDGWRLIMLECSVCPTRAMVRVPFSQPDVLTMSSEAIDAELRAHGYDPEAIGKLPLPRPLPLDAAPTGTPTNDSPTNPPLAAPVGEQEQAEPDSAEWWRQVAHGVAFDYHTLRRLVYALQAHAKECGWQDVDEPIAALLSWRQRPETETNVGDGGDGGD